jgi:hypothetical protein
MSPAEIAQRHEARGWNPRTPGRRPHEASFGRRAESLLLTVGLIIVTLGVGWLAWSVVEWRHGRTASFRITGLRVVRRSTGRPVGICRSVVRNALFCTLLLFPTVLVCAFLAFVFVMGASPPADVLSRPRAAPWDRITDTVVLDERVHSDMARFRLGHLQDAVPISMN